MGGGIFWVGWGGWTIFMGSWAWVEVDLGGLGVCGHFLCVGGHGCGRVEVYFEWVGMDGNFL